MYFAQAFLFFEKQKQGQVLCLPKASAKTLKVISHKNSQSNTRFIDLIFCVLLRPFVANLGCRFAHRVGTRPTPTKYLRYLIGNRFI